MDRQGKAKLPLYFVPAKPAPAVAAAIIASSNTSNEAAKKGIEQSGKCLTRKLAETSCMLNEFDVFT
ncbi:hypothetical protein AWENTII_008901 [Aspergillus wentii]|nr:hypothetical protein MW887_004487 [Aspergillus wentii]